MQGWVSCGPGMETRGDVGNAGPIASRWAQERTHKDRQSLLSAAWNVVQQKTCFDPSSNQLLMPTAWSECPQEALPMLDD